MSSRETSPPLEVAPRAPSPERLGIDIWFLSEAERGQTNSKNSKSPAPKQGFARIPTTSEMRTVLSNIRAAVPLFKDAARSAFLPLPRKEVLDPDATQHQVEEEIVSVPETTSVINHSNPYIGQARPEAKYRFRTLVRSPLAMTLPLTAADLDREIEPPSKHDWLTLYLATLALLIWAAVIYSALDRGLVTKVWENGLNWRVLPGALTDPARTWAVADDVLGVAGVCNGGVCQWTPLV
ncbi:hypothetical protein CcaverHIS002_0209110 [Cutaneotrichosporon cavernicola]|uniref:Uncharacterized protein n=1 Tax=Cutaneotrichosporon cavernicola TaxID=279322 RepID=A0AA48I9H0_9TREE|nr:uncharacterized protein CcaverHIS019_0209120 [Cutaneotrichosporon cavernicola]BEI81751.1 hypothetical protein CcaverHIS002_0209110 [Cutaneotrichosporon cavernicola]BEI89550.1 hypothetical protein CcaverHIS019_0209120 [Cutaneotrichosporon cavernicola]BEI97323.1 hypothetical protein CcaverHIS631_0209120 [Cutaneotrichosporon cavernicola]BEJ05097.1 hypothetical protein CcaverHIS641_0209140 [Cutaneotrichosporon cavernicola]